MKNRKEFIKDELYEYCDDSTSPLYVSFSPISNRMKESIEFLLREDENEKQIYIEMRKLYGPEIIYQYPNFVTQKKQLDPIKFSLFTGGVFLFSALFKVFKKFRK